MKDFRLLFRRIRSSNITIIIISLLLSVAIWSVVKINFSEETTKTLTDIRVALDSSHAEENSFYPFYDENDLLVSVQISGKSYDINSKSFSASDIVVEASSGYIDSAGYKVLNLTASSTNSDITVVSVAPSSVTVFYDRKDTRAFDVEARLTNDVKAVAADKYTIGKLVPNPSTVEVEGPATVISEIKKVAFVATIKDEDLPLTETKELNASIEYEIEGNRGAGMLTCVGIDEKNSPATVTVPISNIQRIPTSVNFINLPEYFSNSTVPVRISPESVDVSFSGTEESVSTVVIGTIDFRELKNAKNRFTFDAASSQVYTVLSDVKSFEVTVDLSSYSSKKITTVPQNIIFIGQDDAKSYAVSDIENACPTVTVIGPAETLKKLDAESLQVEVNVSSLDAKGERLRCDVTNITIPDFGDCWAYGEYNCYINVS